MSGIEAGCFCGSVTASIGADGVDCSVKAALQTIRSVYGSLLAVTGRSKSALPLLMASPGR
jgi:hypothetical protein